MKAGGPRLDARSSWEEGRQTGRSHCECSVRRLMPRPLRPGAAVSSRGGGAAFASRAESKAQLVSQWTFSPSERDKESSDRFHQ